MSFCPSVQHPAEGEPEANAAFFIAKKRRKARAIKNARDRRQHERWQSCNSSMRLKVEHPFRAIKRQFGYTKVRYRGLAETTRRC